MPHLNRHSVSLCILLLAMAGLHARGQGVPAKSGPDQVREQAQRAEAVRASGYQIKYTTDFDWLSAPSTDLSSPGAKTVSLDSCPPAVNGNELEYWVYISGNGTPEAVKVTGGTCAGDGKPGTLQFTTTNAHSAGYTIGSASSGLQEASIAARVQPPEHQIRPQSGRVVVPPGTELQIYARASLRTSYQTVDFSGASFNCYAADTCIFVGDPKSSLVTREVTLLNPSGRPMVPDNTQPMIQVNGQITRIMNVSTRFARTRGTFGAYVQADDDQGFLLDGLDSGYSGIRCDDTFCGSYVTAPGPFNTWSAVGWLKNLNITAGCHGNGVDWQSGNTLHISDSVIQGYQQFGVRTGVRRGGYGGTELDNVYTEEGRACGIAQKGAAGVIAQGGMLTIRSDRMTEGQLPQFQQLGSTFYHYFIVASHAVFGDSMPLAAGFARTDGTTPVEVTWPVIAGITGAGRYKVLRLTWDGKGDKPAPLGTGDWLVGTVDPATCGPARCTFKDTHAAPTRYTSVDTFGGGTAYFPALDFWPGHIILASGHDTIALGAPAKLITDMLPDQGIVSVGRWVDGPIVYAETCQAPGVIAMGPTLNPPILCDDPGHVTLGLKRGFLLQSQALHGSRPNSKGRLNFMSMGGGPWPMITWEDSDPVKTVTDPWYRPLAGEADSDSGMAATGVQYTRANLGIRSYIGALPDKDNWKEQLTAKQKTFAVPVDISEGNTLTLGAGSPLAQMKMYSVKAPEGTAPPQSCRDVVARAVGLTPADVVTGISPPSALGSVSLNAYSSAKDAVTLHFCNPSSATARLPAGNYTFLAVH